MNQPSEKSNDDHGLAAQFADALRNKSVASLLEFVTTLSRPLTISEFTQLLQVELEYRRANDDTIRASDYVSELPQFRLTEDAQAITKIVHETTDAFTVAEPKSVRKSQHTIEPGHTVDDFEVLAELGVGSFATVFLARQMSMQRLVALKVSVDHGMEAQTLAQLDHKNIVRVFDQRRARDLDLQLLYMQYLEGGTLLDAVQRLYCSSRNKFDGAAFVRVIDEAVSKRGASPNYESTMRKEYLESSWEQTVCRLGYSLALALEYAHKKGVLHRDIKPANVLIGADCCVKLADFNISSSETVVGEVHFGGSLAYMSPEQIRAFNPNDDFTPDQLDARCDIYSLGVMLFQVLKGNLPFSSFSQSRSSDGLREMVDERESPNRRVDKALEKHSPLLRDALKKCIEPNLQNRHATARELATQLKIGLDPAAEQFLFPSKNNWTQFFQTHYYIVCIVVTLIFNILAAWFVYNFNLLDSVESAGHDKFWLTQLFVNGVAFPLAIIAFVIFTFPVFRAIRFCLRGNHAQVNDMDRAIFRNLLTGHIQAAICGTLWLIAGIVYPVILTQSGVQLVHSDWADFIASHTLSGIAITALTFFATTYLALRIWLPVLIQNSFSEGVVAAVTTGLNSLTRKIPIYQLLAVSVPLLAISLLVIFDDIMSRSKFALRVISSFGLLTIPVVLFGGNKIRAICEKLQVVFRTDYV